MKSWFEYKRRERLFSILFIKFCEDKSNLAFTIVLTDSLQIQQNILSSVKLNLTILENSVYSVVCLKY